ncbi:MAG: hypothetical protein IJY46_10200 [Lentisphaeria bacterium]|nr:hypothetical protein [Lentisphaeria bacterium]
MMKFVRKLLFAFLFGAMLIPAGFAAEKKSEELPSEVQCPECKKTVKVPKELRRKKKKKKNKKKKKSKSKNKDKDKNKGKEKEASATKTFNCPQCKKPITYPPAAANTAKNAKKGAAAGADAGAETDTAGEE